MTKRTDREGTSSGSRTAFWAVAVIAMVVLIGAWFWYGLVLFDESTDQCSAATGSSTAGSGLILGVIPLGIAYTLAAVSLILIGVRTDARPMLGALVGVLTLVVATLVAIGVNQLIWSGDLFTMSGAATCG